MESKNHWGGETKKLLRESLKNRLPSEMIGGTKRGFALPLSRWLAGPLKEWAEDLLSPAALKNTNLRPSVVREMWGGIIATAVAITRPCYGTYSCIRLGMKIIKQGVEVSFLPRPSRSLVVFGKRLWYYLVKKCLNRVNFLHGIDSPHRPVLAGRRQQISNLRSKVSSEFCC